MQNAKNKAQNQTEETEEIITTKGTQGHSPVDRIIDEYKAEAHRRDTTPTCTIYKYINETSGQDRIFAGYFTGEEIPNRHTIGILYGGGRYFLELYQPKGKAEDNEATSFIFRIHEIYNGLKAKAEAEKAKAEAAALPPGQATNQVQAVQSFAMVKDILSLILPVLKAQTPAQAPAPAARQESPQEMMNSYLMMQKLLKNNLFDTAATFREFNRRFTEAEYTEQEDPGITTEENDKKEGGLLEKIISLIEPFFALIAQKTPAAQFAATTLKAAPQFLEVLNDPALCRMIVQHFDKTKGRQAADIALQNIGINRRQLFATTNQAPGKAAAIRTKPAPGQNPPAGTETHQAAGNQH
jgi:hypothetical protein